MNERPIKIVSWWKAPLFALLLLGPAALMMAFLSKTGPAKDVLSGECEVQLIRGLAIQQCARMDNCRVDQLDLQAFIRAHVYALDHCKIDIGTLLESVVPPRTLGIPQPQHEPGAAT